VGGFQAVADPLGTASGGGGGGKKADPGKKQLGQVLKLYNQAKATQAGDLAGAAATARTGVNTVQKGYADAKKTAANFGLASKKEAVRAGNQAIASNQQNEISRGFGGSNLAYTSGNNVRANTALQLQKIDQQIAEMMSSLNRGSALCTASASCTRSSPSTDATSASTSSPAGSRAATADRSDRAVVLPWS
jgi:hypothetical protein